MNELVNVCMLKKQDGDILKGEDLKTLMEEVIKLNSLLASTSNGDSNFYLLLEQATISSFFNPENFEDNKKLKQTLDYLIKILYKIDFGWEASLVESDFVFFKIQGKIKEEFKISLNSINKNNYNELNKICDKIQEHFLNSSKLSGLSKRFEFVISSRRIK